MDLRFRIAVNGIIHTVGRRAVETVLVPPFLLWSLCVSRMSWWRRCDHGPSLQDHLKSFDGAESKFQLSLGLS